MGLDTTHKCWHGTYSTFMRWREKIAELAGLPPLQLMEGFYTPFSEEMLDLPTLYYRGYHEKVKGPCGIDRIDQQLPIKWECLKPSPLHFLLYHSDCEGKIPWKRCKSIAKELEKLLPKFSDEDAESNIINLKEKTQTFINGLRLATNKKENVEFH